MRRRAAPLLTSLQLRFLALCDAPSHAGIENMVICKRESLSLCSLVREGFIYGVCVPTLQMRKLRLGMD